MNAAAFAAMKPGSVFINTPRGGLVVEADLIAALQSGHLGGAGLDVFEQEPTDPKNPLFKMDNVVVCPHLGGGDTQSIADMGAEAANCVVASTAAVGRPTRPSSTGRSKRAGDRRGDLRARAAWPAMGSTSSASTVTATDLNPGVFERGSTSLGTSTLASG